VHSDDLKNPEYRKGRVRPPQTTKPEAPRRPAQRDDARRIHFATQTARAEFGRFYWNDDLGRRMRRELEKSRRHLREIAERTSKRKRNGR
jgi:hypothetical protein